MAEMHSNRSLAVLAPINVNERSTDISVLVQDRNGCLQSRQRSEPQGGCVKDGGTKQIVLSLGKQSTDKQGWKRRHWHRESARRWLQHRAGVEMLDVRPPTRIAGREELQVVAQIASSSYDGALRASGTDGVMTLPSTRQRRKTPSSAPCLYLWISSLEGALDRAFGAVTTRLGLAVRVKKQQTSRVVGCVWTAALMGPRCCDTLSCWLAGDPVKTLTTRKATGALGL